MNARAQTDTDDVGAVWMNTCKTCGIKMKMVTVMVTTILIYDH